MGQLREMSGRFEYGRNVHRDWCSQGNLSGAPILASGEGEFIAQEPLMVTLFARPSYQPANDPCNDSERAPSHANALEIERLTPNTRNPYCSEAPASGPLPND
jgi:hypothetical protein